MSWALSRCSGYFRDPMDTDPCPPRASVLVGEAHESRECNKIELF